jgi:uncharacterized membrane protein
LKSGGSIKVQLITDTETAESLRNHCEENHFRKVGDGTSDFPVFTYELAKEIGCSAEALLGNVYYKNTYQQQRTAHNTPFFTYQSHRNHATHFVYFIDNSDGTITTHFEYNEPSYDWIRYSHVQYMILFVQLCVLLFLLHIIHSKKCLCFYVVKKILGINISNMNFEYENTLHWLTPTGRLLLKLPLRAEQTDKLFKTFSASNPDATADFQKADELLSEFPNFEEAEPVASVLAYQPQVRWTLFGYKKACTLLLHLTKHSDGQMILYLYYKESE